MTAVPAEVGGPAARAGEHRVEDRPHPREDPGLHRPRRPRAAVARADLGLLLTSLIAPEQIQSTRLVGDALDAEPPHPRELRRDPRQRRDHGRDLDDPLDLARRDRDPDRRGRSRGLRVRLARVPGPRLDLPRRRRAARRADPDGPDPDLSLYNDLGLFDTILGLVSSTPRSGFLLRSSCCGASSSASSTT